MANNKELVSSDSASSPEFIQELLPSAERTALLYNLSYLCLGGFPKLERLLRQRAVETQMLFGSSEALLLKCEGTSQNLVKSLLPSLKVAAEKNKPQLAQKILEKAKEWIGDIITDVKDIVKRYEKHNSDVAASTSDIITEKKETEKKHQQQTSEMEALQKIVDGLEKNLGQISNEIKDYDKKIAQKNAEIQQYIGSMGNTKDVNAMQMPGVTALMGSSVAIFSMIVPFVENIIGFISKMVMATSQEKVIKTLQSGLIELSTARRQLKEREWTVQNQLMDNHLKLAKLKIENGQLPSVTHLDEVQVCLSRIQQILVQLQKFWEKVCSLLDTLKKRTFAGEDWMDELENMKEHFLESIDAASEGWTKFGISCAKANKIFSIQANKAYNFLEISPSSLSKEKWEIEYASVKEKLQKIKPNVINSAAITQ